MRSVRYEGEVTSQEYDTSAAATNEDRNIAKDFQLRRLSATKACDASSQTSGTPGSVSVVVDEYTLQAAFSCGASTNKITPGCSQEAHQTQCCNDGSCTACTTPIGDAIGAPGNVIKDNATGTYTVTLEKMPEERRRKMFYKCIDGTDDGKTRVVTVTTPGDPGAGKEVRGTAGVVSPSVEVTCLGEPGPVRYSVRISGPVHSSLAGTFPGQRKDVLSSTGRGMCLWSMLSRRVEVAPRPSVQHFFGCFVWLADECTLDKSIRLEISKPTLSASFVCKGPGGTALQSVRVGDCMNEKDVQALVPGATLPGSRENTGGAYTITLPYLPATPIKMCYRCAYPDPNPSTYLANFKPPSQRPCYVLVLVDGDPSTASSTTTRPMPDGTPTADGAVGCAVGALTVLISCSSMALRFQVHNTYWINSSQERASRGPHRRSRFHAYYRSKKVSPRVFLSLKWPPFATFFRLAVVTTKGSQLMKTRAVGRQRAITLLRRTGVSGIPAQIISFQGDRWPDSTVPTAQGN